MEMCVNSYPVIVDDGFKEDFSLTTGKKYSIIFFLALFSYCAFLLPIHTTDVESVLAPRSVG